MGVISWGILVGTWQVKTFTIKWGLPLLACFGAICPILVFGTLNKGGSALYKATQNFGTIIVEDSSVFHTLMTDFYIPDHCKGRVALYSPKEFKEFILTQYDAHAFAALTEKRLNMFLEKWEEEACGADLAAVPSSVSTTTAAVITK